MLGGDKAFVEFGHINELNKAVWIEENGRKIFDPEIFKIRRNEKIVFYTGMGISLWFTAMHVISIYKEKIEDVNVTVLKEADVLGENVPYEDLVNTEFAENAK